MLVADNLEGWPKYFYHDCSYLRSPNDILVFRYDHPDQKFPWLRWLDNGDVWTRGFGSYQAACTYPELVPVTREELVAQYAAKPDLFDNQGMTYAFD